ncbi:MAG: hypothetical protein NNA22_10690 [Nitrospira sp.]|nr:hypothetical protein [Nitrospira sp.]MCP9456525.1 hypothetical protein [Nitrospira sp.]
MSQSAGGPDRVAGQGRLQFYRTTAEFNDNTMVERIMSALPPFTFLNFPLHAKRFIAELLNNLTHG